MFAAMDSSDDSSDDDGQTHCDEEFVLPPSMFANLRRTLDVLNFRERKSGSATV